VARSADFDLTRELAKPSFTPGVRDAPALVALIVAGDEPAAARAATALAQLAAAGTAAIDAALAGGAPTIDAAARIAASSLPAAGAAGAAIDDGAAARLVAALGLLARGGDAGARGAVIARAADRAPRVRKAAAVALGKLGGEDARRAVIARWDAGDAAPEERRALAEALGKLGGGDALARLRALDAGGDAELARRRDRAVLMVERTAGRGAVSRIRDDAAPPAPVLVRLGCRPGLGALLGDELAALRLPARPVGDRGAELRLAGPIGALFASRLWATLAIPFPLAAGDDLAAAIAATVTSPGVLGLLRAWTRGPIRWRLGFAQGHRRAVVWRVARDVTAAVPDLINDPTATTWDVVIDDAARTLSLVPRRLDDPRFAYRAAEVAAASHPTVAAALAWVAEARPGDRVWDPFCGSGLELIERARRGPLRSLTGSDLDPAALDAARANLAAAGVAAELAIADACAPRPGPPGSVDLIITNPPLGSRVQIDAPALLTAALPGFARALAPGGRLVWITPAARRTTPVAEQLGLIRSHQRVVDLGGVRGQLERWDRP
jgi:precorrin-6B methylase 2